jgi:histidine triad (HIT) family protein
VQEVLRVVRNIAADIERDHGVCRLLTNLGEYQESKHQHFHEASGSDFGANIE